MVQWIVGGALIQSKNPRFGVFRGGKFAAAVFSPPTQPGKPWTLAHYWLDPSRPDNRWVRGLDISIKAAGPGAIIQSSFGSPGNFEVVVPEYRPTKVRPWPELELAHYWHDNSGIASVWKRSATVAPCTGHGSIVQNRKNGNLEVVVPNGQELRYFWRDASGWHQGDVITSTATGPACMIQSSYGKLELVVLEGPRRVVAKVQDRWPIDEGRSNLVHYRRDDSNPSAKWQFGGVITSRATGPAGFIQGSYGRAPNRNFEVVVPEGDVLAHYWRDNTDSNVPWYPGGVVTRGAGPIDAATLIESSLVWGHEEKRTRGFVRSLEVLSQENGGSIYHYYRYRDGSGFRWFRGHCLRVNELDIPDADRSRPRSQKIVQLTGEKDLQQNTDAYNKTECKFDIRGTDLGSSFVHRGRLYFLFGDTHWTQSKDKPPIEGTLDSIAYTTMMDASQGLPLVFHRAYLRIEIPTVSLWTKMIENPPVSLKMFEVPLDGFSFAGRMFVFFSTDFSGRSDTDFPHRKVMGRSVLARCLDIPLDFESSSREKPLRFQYLTSFSDLKFINVSVERVNAATIQAYRLPAETDGLLIWGTGAYRNDNIYLAFLPLDDPRTRDNLFAPTKFAFSQLAVRYFTGEHDGVAGWSVREEDAVPLFYPAAIGELSVRWNAHLSRWVCMYCSGPEDPIGGAVVLRVARRPWGPWSRRRLVLDWWAHGLGRFIHKHGSDDGLDDQIIIPEVGGAAYAPYQLPLHTRVTARGISLYYVLSTYNPYQVMLMRHDMTLGQARALEGPAYVQQSVGTRPSTKIRGTGSGEER